MAGALTASFQNLDDTILIESDSYARSETYTQLETGAAITAAIDALDLSQFQNEAEVQALIAAALVPYWDQTEVSTYVAGELANYATSSSVTSAISSALSSYDNSSQVDSKIITALLDVYTRTEVDQQITNALGNVDLSNYYTQAETQSYVASELLAFYPRTELDSQLTATFTQYWTSGRTQTEIDDAIAGAGFLTQAQADTRYFAVSANASFESLVRTNVTPPMIKALLCRAPLAASTILTDTTLELTCDAYTKAEADGRYLSNSNFAPLDARYFVRNPAVAEGNGIFHLAQEQFTPHFIRSLLPSPRRAILGNGSVIEIEADCWSKAQSDSRYPLVATFNSLGSTVTSIDGRVSTLETDVGAIDGRVTALENSGGVAPTADLTVNSLTATTFVETPQSAAGDLQIQNALVTVRKEDGALLASFADGGISLDRDVTVAAASTLNATTADITQLTVGSTAATGAFNSNSSVTANLEVVSNLRLEAPLVRCDPTAPWLSIEEGAQGVLVNDTLRVNGAIDSEASLPYLFLSGGTTGLEMNTKFAAVTGLGDPGGFCELAVINQAPTGVARLFLSTQNNAPTGGRGELVALANGGVQLNALNQFISLNTTSDLANLAVEPNTGGSSNGELIFGYGFVNLSDKALKTNVRDLSEKELQETFDAVEPRIYDRIEGGKDQIGFIAQEVQATPLGERVCKTKNLDGRDLMTLDYQKLNVVLWNEVPAEANREAGEEEARAFLKWQRTERWSFSGGWPGCEGPEEALSDREARVPGPAGPDHGPGPGSPAKRRGQASPGTQAKEPGEECGGGAERPAPSGPGGLQPEHARRNKFGLVVTDVFTREVATKALPDKRAETVTAAAAEIIPGLVQEEGNYVVTTDLGNEFRGLEEALPEGVVHRQKDPTDRNATAVVDRAIQTLKKDLAGKVARDGGGWAEHVDEATEAYNARPHEAVTVAPEDVETMPAATFRVYQDNARKFKHNDELTRSRQRRLEEAGAFRAPTNAARSFQPQYGAVREVSSYDSMMVRATDGSETLLKHALPVPRGSGEPVARLTRRPVPLAVRQLRDFNPGPTAP